MDMNKFLLSIHDGGQRINGRDAFKAELAGLVETKGGKTSLTAAGKEAIAPMLKAKKVVGVKAEPVSKVVTDKIPSGFGKKKR